MAFSNAYLTTNEAAHIDHGVSFRVAWLLPGTVTRLPASDSRRWCSVAVGKVRVSINDEPEFIIGPNGLFKIRPGDTCTVSNWLYINAALHISAIAAHE